ncbi:bifunctional UDP-4-keto-pentose/UDP-xylose synthase [Candidatus Kaiserbacteria bacterium]|nr:bifunctional UDP-4-keto-pentose/UDP-xylose synthase [Candidatus Kaiserbacteria bacterium]
MAKSKKKTILVFGANGFIGQHLVRHILEHKDWHVIANDLKDAAVREHRDHERFEFHKGDIFNKRLMKKLVERADVVVPLAGIATPKTYILNPLRVYEVDFEANLAIVRMCVEAKKRVIWPSTSEVYGMSTDKEFHPDTSHLVMGPIGKMRWIYAASKQLMDRIIFAYGRDHGLEFTIFRPFNWIGYGQDDIHDTGGNARLITQFAGNILRGENLNLVDGGTNRRSFTHIDDAIDALVRIIENKGNVAAGKIYNIGNPQNNKSIAEIAEMMLKIAPKHPSFIEGSKKVRIVITPSHKHYGEGYQDMINRTPYVRNTQKDLQWKPKVTTRMALENIFAAYERQLSERKK